MGKLPPQKNRREGVFVVTAGGGRGLKESQVRDFSVWLPFRPAVPHPHDSSSFCFVLCI